MTPRATLVVRAASEPLTTGFAAKRPVKIGSIGPGTSLSDVPKLLKAALGLPLDMVEGYKGGAEARLAVESGEVDGLCASWQATKVTWRSQWSRERFASCCRPP